MIKIPSYLKKGDTIAIVCPAGFLPLEKAKTCIETLESWGYRVKIGKTLGNQSNYFSGTDAERMADLQCQLDDPEVKAILCGRGGYGVSRIVDGLDFKQFKKNPKWLIGFSDITVLLAHLLQQVNTASLHAPMANAFNEGGANNVYVQSLQKALKGTKTSIQINTHPHNKMGKGAGVLIGGNLSLIVHLIGTKGAYQTKNNILFIEDIGEHIYQVDRMFLQLKRAGFLEGLAGLILGGFTDIQDTTVPFGTDVLTAISAHLKEYTYPVCVDFPVSHGTENFALKVGVLHQLTVTKNKALLNEIR